MKAYVVVIEDRGYLGLGSDCDGGYIIESVYSSFEDALSYIQKKYEPLIQLYVNLNLPSDRLYKDDIKGIYQYFDDEDHHMYEITIFEKEFA